MATVAILINVDMTGPGGLGSVRACASREGYEFTRTTMRRDDGRYDPRPYEDDRRHDRARRAAAAAGTIATSRDDPATARSRHACELTLPPVRAETQRSAGCRRDGHDDDDAAEAAMANAAAVFGARACCTVDAQSLKG